MVYSHICTVFYCQKSLFKECSFSHLAIFFLCLLSAYTMMLGLRGAAIEFLKTEVPQRAIMRLLGMFNATLMMMLSGRNKPLSCELWLWMTATICRSWGLHAQQADQDYRERWVDNPLLVCTYLQPKKDEETAFICDKNN